MRGVKGEDMRRAVMAGRLAGWLSAVGWLVDVCRQLPTVLLAGIGWLSAGVDAIALKTGVR